MGNFDDTCGLIYDDSVLLLVFKLLPSYLLLEQVYLSLSLFELLLS